MTVTISNDSRARIKKAFEPIALGMGRLGLTPDALTLIGFAITVIGAVLVAGQLWLAAGLVILFGGVFDMFDGTLARATGKVSNLGAFYDSVFDRAGEVIVYVGLVIGLQELGILNGTVLAAAAMGSAVLVSYTRSRSEGLGFTSGSGMAAVGIMTREVRLIILSAGLVLAGLLGTAPDNGSCATCAGGAAFQPGAGVLFLALGIIAVGSILTTIQRILHVRRQARRQST
ncbi:MAG TPA: CDP-alcohol phosphatidyltransferase family protein [Candidatus Limnocylindrales bacterium]